MEGVEKLKLRLHEIPPVRYAVHNMAESISRNTMLETLNLSRLRWYMHNDVHKVTARNKWRVSRKKCLFIRGMLSAHIISLSQYLSSNTIL
jgi:hypothetical protein